MTFTAKEKRQCAEREVRQRRHVYGRLVDAGKMTRAKADRETEIMQDICDDYARAVEQEETAGRLL